MRPSLRPLVRRLLRALLVAASVPLTASCEAVGVAGARSTILGELEGARVPRTFGPRLSVTTAYRTCALNPAPEGTIPVVRCDQSAEDAVPPERVLRLASLAARAAPLTSDPDTLHAIALVDLLWADAAGKSLSRSISYLETAARLSDDPAPIFMDLAAAHLVRAERTQNPRDLLEAVEFADRALELEPESPAALFNLALALDHLGLDSEAREAWQKFRKSEQASGWATEAERRLGGLREVHGVQQPPSPGAYPDDVAAFVAGSPQEARLLGWDRVLGEWGEAILKGDTARAAARLRLAGMLGDELERRQRDATLADAVRAIHTHARESVARMKLAQAHHEYAEGRSAYLALDRVRAGRHFSRVLALRPPSVLLQRWAGMFHAATLVQAGQRQEAEQAFGQLAAQTDSVRYPALAGSLQWGLATTLLRDGTYEQALDGSRAATSLFRRAGETEHLGGAWYLVADAESNLGARVAASASMYRALTLLRPYRRSVWLCNLLAVASRTAQADGLSGAAIRLQNERTAVADLTGQPVYQAEARLGRAQVLIAAGKLAPARADIEAGEALVRRIELPDARTWLRMDLQLARAGVLLRGDPGGAAAVLDSVVGIGGGARTAFRRMRALVGRAEARLATGDSGGASDDLGRAVALLVQQREALARAPLRASLLDAAHGVFDQIAMLKVGEGDTVAALSYLERGRTSFAPLRPGTPAPVTERWSMPRGSVGVVYALIGDTLLTWTVADTTVRLVRRTVDRAGLIRTIEHVRSSLEQGLSDDVRPQLTSLYDRLIRPVQPRLGEKGTRLVLVADGEISGAPFSALFDAARRRYLVEDHPLSFAANLRDAGSPAAKGRVPEGAALLVADPAFDAGFYPGLSRLKGARAEVDSIAAGYPDRAVLADSAATGPAVGVELGNASVVHFAGHAVFDDRRPEESFLVLAQTRGARGPDRLTAAQIGAMNLRPVRLVVLSACRTLRTSGGRSGGFAGFADALLGAGVDGVVGSLWKVDDQHTTSLMTGFHRAYRSSGDGPGALRHAQLLLLHNEDPALRSPAAWAGFRYAGN